MNVATLPRLADTPTQAPHDAMTVTPHLHLADVALYYVITAAVALPHLLTEAGDRLLTEGGDLLTTES